MVPLQVLPKSDIGDDLWPMVLAARVSMVCHGHACSAIHVGLWWHVGAMTVAGALGDLRIVGSPVALGCCGRYVVVMAGLSCVVVVSS